MLRQGNWGLKCAASQDRPLKLYPAWLSFEEFSFHSLDDFVGDDWNKLLLCYIWACLKYLSQTEQFRPGIEGLFESTGRVKKRVSRSMILFWLFCHLHGLCFCFRRRLSCVESLGSWSQEVFNVLYLLAWLHEDLRGSNLPACLGNGLTSHHMAAAGSNSEPSYHSHTFPRHAWTCDILLELSTWICLIWQYHCLVPCASCKWKSTLKRLVYNFYEDTFIAYKCPQYIKEGETCRKTIIQKMPPILVLYLTPKRRMGFINPL